MAPSILTATLLGCCLTLAQCQDEPLGAVSSSKLQIHVSWPIRSTWPLLCCLCLWYVDLLISFCLLYSCIFIAYAMIFLIDGQWYQALALGLSMPRWPISVYLQIWLIQRGHCWAGRCRKWIYIYTAPKVKMNDVFAIESRWLRGPWQPQQSRLCSMQRILGLRMKNVWNILCKEWTARIYCKQTTFCAIDLDRQTVCLFLLCCCCCFFSFELYLITKSFYNPAIFLASQSSLRHTLSKIRYRKL